MTTNKIFKLKKSLIEGIRFLQIENKLKRRNNQNQSKEKAINSYSSLILSRQLETFM